MRQLLILVLLFTAAGVAWADTQFRVRQMTRDDVPSGKGQCDIRLHVDNEAEVSFRDESVEIRTISGRDGRDAGSECNAPFRGRDAIRSFQFEKRDGRGNMRVVEEPSRRNGNALVVAIRDSDGGEGRYHFRVSWTLDGDGRGGFRRPGYGRPDYDSGVFDLDNREIDTTVRGRGEYSLGGSGDRNLDELRVQLRRGGEAYLEFRGRTSASFTGRWSRRGSDRITLTLRRFGSADADGSGEIQFRRGEIDRVDLEGRTYRPNDRFEVRFDARR